MSILIDAWENLSHFKYVPIKPTRLFHSCLQEKRNNRLRKETEYTEKRKYWRRNMKATFDTRLLYFRNPIPNVNVYDFVSSFRVIYGGDIRYYTKSSEFYGHSLFF